jgi:hypothetical protein
MHGMASTRLHDGSNQRGNSINFPVSYHPWPPDSQPDMHDCLRISEIARSVCIALDNTDSKDSIAKLARTCKAFHDPALDVLWYSMKDFSQLIMMCMPSDLWAFRDGCLILVR